MTCAKLRKPPTAATKHLREPVWRYGKEGRWGAFVFPGRNGNPILVTSLGHQHSKVRELLKMPEDFVVHSLRHTMWTRIGLLGVDAFTITKVAGHSSITISQRYVHPSPESVERAFEKLEAANRPTPRKGVGIGTKNGQRQNRRKSDS